MIAAVTAAAGFQFPAKPPPSISLLPKTLRPHFPSHLFRSSVTSETAASITPRSGDGDGNSNGDGKLSVDCVVVGGGISGLCTAQALATRHAGEVPAVLVTEGQDRVGGNIMTVERDGYLWEEGPNSFQPSDAMLSMAMASRTRSGKAPDIGRPAVERASVGVSYYVEFADNHSHLMSYFMQSEISNVIVEDAFSSVFVRDFYTNMKNPRTTVPPGSVASTVQGYDIVATHDDLRREFQLTESSHMLDVVEKFRADRDWSAINQVLHGRSESGLITTKSSLSVDAYIIQEILRSTVLLKSGDSSKITAQLSMVTYYILDSIQFDVTDLLLSLMRYCYKLKSPDRQRENNLPLGGILQRVVYKKYEGLLEVFYINDRFPSLLHTSTIRVPRARDLPSTSTAPSVRRASSVREPRRGSQLDADLRRQLDAIQREAVQTRKDVSGVKKMLKYMMRKLNLTPTHSESAEWASPVEDPPRRSLAGQRRRRSTSQEAESSFYADEGEEEE